MIPLGHLHPCLLAIAPSDRKPILDLSSTGEFLSKFTTLYLDSFLTNVVIGVLLGALGLFVILRRMVFLSAALSQVAGAGLAFAFFLGALLAHSTDRPMVAPLPPARPEERLDLQKPETPDDQEIQSFLEEDAAAKKSEPTDASSPDSRRKPAAPTGSPPRTRLLPIDAPGPRVSAEAAPYARHGQHTPINPLVVSLLLTIGVAILLSLDWSGRFRSTQESVVGLVFILASAATIVLAQLAEKGAHEIAEFMFGTVIFIPKDQQRMIIYSAAAILTVYAVCFKDFVFVSFDPVAARASRFPVGLVNGLLFLLIAVSIALCTRAVGAMPVFALTVLPAAASLQIHNRMVPALITSSLLGGASAAGGYFLSGLLNLSAGPLMVLVATLCVLFAWTGRMLVTWISLHHGRS